VSARSVSVTIGTSDAGFVLKIKERETTKDEDRDDSHTEQESSSQEFAVYGSALDAATATLKRFEAKLKLPEGGLFG